MNTASQPAGAEQAWTVGGLLEWTERFLAQKGVEFPRLDASVLLAHALGCKRIDLYGVRHGEAATEEVRQRYKELIRRRVEGCPVAYLVGRKEFYSMEFEVGPAVLIPRPDSEVAVVECLRLTKALAEPRILDVGTGSGNLAVAIAKHQPRARMTAVDISPDALAVAQRNAARHGVADRVQFLVSELFAALAPGERFDLIVSNPPYIPSEDVKGLAPGVRDYEPHLALDGGPDGYAIFARLVAEAPQYLEKAGYLVLEIGSPQEGPARERITAHAGYELAATVHDHSRHPRVLLARRRGE
jgi:release factor glutamine methyltransferase